MDDPDTSDPDDLAAECWAPRVEPATSQRLDRTDALGVVDEDQMDEVGSSLEVGSDQ